MFSNGQFTPSLVQIMACRLFGDKPLSEQMVVWLTDVYMRHSVSINERKLHQNSTVLLTHPVRLADGDDEGAGRVEVFYDGEWGTVCDDLWDSYDAQVICRELGFEGGEALGMAYYGQGAGPIWLDSVECVGDEASLFDCQHQPWGDHDCSHAEDAAIRCRMYKPAHCLCWHVWGDFVLLEWVFFKTWRTLKLSCCEDDNSQIMSTAPIP